MWHENQPPSCVPQVCKFDRYVILMFGCLLVRSVMHLMCFCNLLVLRLFPPFCSSVWKIKISVIKGNNFYYTCGCAFQFLSVIGRAPHQRIWMFFSFYGHCSRSPGSRCTFKKSSLKHATFRICGDNPKIPSSWITTVFYSPWHGAQGVKSWLATRGHSEGKPALLRCCLSSAAHLTSKAFKLIMLGTHVTEVIWNTFCHEYVTTHTL